jgi:hypothetical protein
LPEGGILRGGLWYEKIQSQMSNYSAISSQEQVIIDEMIMISALC